MGALEDARKSVERIQQFDTSVLPRRDELGAKFAFEEAVPPAEKIVSLFKKLPLDILDELPTEFVTSIKSQSDQIYNLFSQILDFDNTQPDAANQKTRIIKDLTNQYSNVFRELYSFISYAVARTVDFNRLEAEGRAAVQSVSDKTDAALAAIKATSEQATKILEDVRMAAAEQGVSQQAVYFANEAKDHEEQASVWRKRTQVWAIVLGLYGLAIFIAAEVPALRPETLAEAVQLIASKLVVFFVISFMLVLSSRNFMFNRHNSIVNRQRQNALQTFNALVDAGGTPEARDVVLQHAASSIFKPQDTGYVSAPVSGGAMSTSIVDLIPKASMKIDGAS